MLLALSMAAFVGVIATEMYRRVEITAHRSQQNLLKEEARLVMGAFEAQIQNPETCTRMLYDQVITPGMAEGTPVTLNYVYDESANPGVPTLTAGSPLTLGLKLEGVEVFAPGIPDRYDEILEGGLKQSRRRYAGALRAAFSDGGSKLAPVNFRRDSILGTEFGIPLYVWTDADNRIKVCFGLNSAGAVCNLARGYYQVSPPGTPQLGHQISCRQTGYMTQEIDAAGNPGVRRGTCRFVGFASPGRCPAGSFVPGVPYEFPIHDGTGLNNFMLLGMFGFNSWFPYGQAKVICAQCQ